MIYRVTRVKSAALTQDRQGYYIEAVSREEAIREFCKRFPLLKDEIELQEWG